MILGVLALLGMPYLAASVLPERLSIGAAATTELSAYYDASSDSFKAAHSFDEQADGYARLYANVSGWYYLDAFANSDAQTAEAALLHQRAMGFVEGHLTCQQTADFFANFYYDSFDAEGPTEGTLQFVQQNYEYMIARADALSEESDYWFAIKQLLAQLDGLQEGFHAGCPEKKLSQMDFLLLNAFGDLYDITVATSDNPEATAKRLNTPGRAKFHVLRCSSLIKMLPDLSDVVFGHTTWDLFVSAAPRIFKRYNFPLMRNGVAAEKYDMYFSSSPGLLSSVDDFYVTRGQSKLAVIETTNEVLNTALYRYLTPKSVLSWARVMVASQLATDAFDWANLFSEEASGTYTDQWQVLDLTKHTPGQLPRPGFFVMLEELPGAITTRDMTASLTHGDKLDGRADGQGYWPSYNIPYFMDIYERSGNAAACRFTDPGSCYDTCPRANLFRAHQDKVDSVEEFMYLVQYNDWQNDPLSEGSPTSAIAARGDLRTDPATRIPFGGIDGKVSTVSLSLQEEPVFYARLGPTTDDQPVFCWTPEFDEYPHFGHPECFDFEWTVMPPSN